MVALSDTEIAGRLRPVFSRMWPAVLGEGVLAAVVGLLLLVSPVRSVVFLVQALGIYWFLGGIGRASTAVFRRRQNPGWGWRLGGGAVHALLGAAILAYPLYASAFSGIALVYTIAFFAAWGGVLDMGWAVTLLGTVPGEWPALTGGQMSVILAILLFAAPFFAVSALLAFAGICAVLGGAGQILLSVRLMRFSRGGEEPSRPRQFVSR